MSMIKTGSPAAPKPASAVKVFDQAAGGFVPQPELSGEPCPVKGCAWTLSMCPDGSKFCGKCGTKVPAPAGPAKGGAA